MRLPENGAVTGWAALRLHGGGFFDGLDRTGKIALPVPMTVPPSQAPRPVSGVRWRREELDPSEVQLLHGIPCTTPERATFDAVRRAGDLRSAVTALDMASASRITTLDRMRAYVEDRVGWPGVVLTRRALDLSDDRAMSPPECALRLVWMVDAGLPRPLSNWPVADLCGVVIGRPDLLSVELGVLGEFDGAGHRSREQQRDDVRRDEAFREVGLEPFRVVGEDLSDTGLLIDRFRRTIQRAQGRERRFLIASSPPPVCRL